MKKFFLCLMAFYFLAPISANADETGETRQVVETLFRLFNAYDVDGMLALYHPDVMKSNPENPEPTYGAEYIREIYEGIFQTLPKVHDEVTRIVAEGQNSAVEFTASWENPDGSRGSLRIAAFLKVVDGLIVEDITYYDRKGNQSE